MTPISPSNILLPQIGETYISWLIRLAQANGFSDPRPFLNRYVKKDEGFNLSCIDDRLPVKGIFGRLDLDMSLLDFYSLFAMTPKIAPFMTDLAINSVYLKSFYEPYGYEIPFKASTVSGIMIRSKICPECWKENQMILQEHNYDPQIKVCARHGIPLMELQLKKGFYNHKNLLDLSDYQTLEVEDLEAEIRLSEYIKRFAEKNYSLTRKEMYRFIYRNIEPNSNLLRDRKIRDGFGLYEGCRRIMAKYPNPDVLDDLLQPYLIRIDETKIQQMGFELLSSISCNCISVRHKKCGEEFITSYGAITDGYGCPCCDKDKDSFKKVSDLIRFKSEGSFTLKTMLPKTTVEIVHTCGTAKKITLVNYLGYTPECTGCSEYRKKQDAARSRNLVFRKSEGKLEYVGQVGRNRKKYKCVVCGRTFDLNNNTFNVEGFCRLCKEEEEMKKKIDKQLENKPDLKVIRYPTIENKTVRILCTNCDEPFDYPYRNISGYTYNNSKPNKRIDAYNCPICSYSIHKKNGRLYKLIKEKFTDRPFTVAEVNRISSEYYRNSSFRVLMKKNLIRKVGTVKKTQVVFALPGVEAKITGQILYKKWLLEIIRKHFKPGQVFTSEDLEKLPELIELGINRKILRSKLGVLVKETNTKRVKSGIFVLGEPQ